MGALLDFRLRRQGACRLRSRLGRPIYHAVTAANVNDISAAKAMPIEAGATYVFDLGYYDFGFFSERDTRLPAGDALQDQYTVERAARNAP